MFTHIAQIGNEFVVRRWGLFGFMYWMHPTDSTPRGYWWGKMEFRHATRYPDAESARRAYERRKSHLPKTKGKFVSWIW